MKTKNDHRLFAFKTVVAIGFLNGIVFAGSILFLRVTFFDDATDISFGTLYLTAAYGYLIGVYGVGTYMATLLERSYNKGRDDGGGNTTYKFTTITYKDSGKAGPGVSRERSDDKGLNDNP